MVVRIPPAVSSPLTDAIVALSGGVSNVRKSGEWEGGWRVEKRYWCSLKLFDGVILEQHPPVWLAVCPLVTEICRCRVGEFPRAGLGISSPPLRCDLSREASVS